MTELTCSRYSALPRSAPKGDTCEMLPFKSVQAEPPRIVRVLGVKPSGEEIWERTVTGVGFIAPSIAVDPVRRGVWVVGTETATAVLHDEETGDVRETIRGADPDVCRCSGSAQGGKNGA